MYKLSDSGGGSRISSFFALVSGHFPECPKPAKSGMGARNSFRFFCGVWCVFVGSGFVGLVFSFCRWVSDSMVFSVSFWTVLGMPKTREAVYGRSGLLPFFLWRPMQFRELWLCWTNFMRTVVSILVFFKVSFWTVFGMPKTG